MQSTTLLYTVFIAVQVHQESFAELRQLGRQQLIRSGEKRFQGADCHNGMIPSGKRCQTERCPVATHCCGLESASNPINNARSSCGKSSRGRACGRFRT